MVDTFLVPKSTVTTPGDGPAVEIGSAGNRVFLLQFNITEIVEQESIDLSIYGAASQEGPWSAAPLASYPQKFYRGRHPLLLDLTTQPEIKFLRAHWEVNRWGRGPETPRFEFEVKITEVSPEVLREAQGGTSPGGQ
jgi:hypothetical protein